MSNARSHRRRLRGAKLRAELGKAETTAPAVMFGSGQGDGSLHHPIRVGNVLHLVMVPPAGASEALLMAYSARATASVTGQCPICGARRHLRPGDHEHRLEYPHENWCPATDDNLAAQRQREQAP